MAYRIGFGYEQQWPGIYIYDDEDGKVIASEDVMPNEDFMHLWNDSSLDPRPAHSLNLLMSIGEDLDKLAPVKKGCDCKELRAAEDQSANLVNIDEAMRKIEASCEK